MFLSLLRHSGFFPLCLGKSFVVFLVGLLPRSLFALLSFGWWDANLAGGSASCLVFLVCVLVVLICQAACDHRLCNSFLTYSFFSCKDRALERDRPYQRKKKCTETKTLGKHLNSSAAIFSAWRPLTVHVWEIAVQLRPQAVSHTMGGRHNSDLAANNTLSLLMNTPFGTRQVLLVLDWTPEQEHSGFLPLCHGKSLFVVVFVGPCPFRFLLCLSAGWRNANLARGSACRLLVGCFCFLFWVLWFAMLHDHLCPCRIYFELLLHM